MTHSLALVTSPDPGIRADILDGLRDFNSTVLFPGLQVENVAVVIRDDADGAIIGGLWGRTGLEWLTIELIFVPEHLRGQGIARRIIAMAEEEALRRGCHSAWLDTLNPDALFLYERLGYARFGELADFPTGRSRYFLQKKLKAC
ncbi:GNAT family N-acetyltransferase [Microvirga subterranea]|uniref:Acetyltransferase (GNAT) family protein n=1 Tax=Microvirga subterranea TaxID=186651 RepID=A0A370HWB9_9HYPH|nr:GNAT family N-acetyltransferase [Microvirga subterranea]RDI62590.1 acetyltransferase (GNAT) family protein [Microvirga subterranea]